MATNNSHPQNGSTKQESITAAAERQMRELDLTTAKCTPKSASQVSQPRAATANAAPVSSGRRVVTPGSSAANRSSSTPRNASTTPTGGPKHVLSPTLSSAASDAGSDGGVPGKKLSMNKIVVGNAPSPQISKVTSKIGSLANTSYKPGGGKVKIESKKTEWKAESRIGSLQNVTHKAGGGDIKIPTKKVEVKAQSRIGSLSNVKYTPGGGAKKIFDDKEYLRRARSSTGTDGRKMSESITGEGDMNNGGSGQEGGQPKRSSSLARGD